MRYDYAYGYAQEVFGFLFEERKASCVSILFVPPTVFLKVLHGLCPFN